MIGTRFSPRPVAMSLALLLASSATLPATAAHLFESTFESHKTYADPFNDVDVDVVFRKDGRSWRVPTFWRGGSRWTVRFVPPEPGRYRYRLESTDRRNPDLNGHAGEVTLTPYTGDNALLKHGMLRVSANKRYFEHADGTPFYWLGDTWWTGLSDRIEWDGFQELTADRKAKGFTVVQIVAGLIPGYEEQAPADPGFCNEGGCVWGTDFKRINPGFFDYADRRLQLLLDSGIVPALVGAWADHLSGWGKDRPPVMTLEQMKKHWRYLIARYGAFPVFWIAGGEISEPPGDSTAGPNAGAWTEVARYIRATDPYHHPLSVHELSTDDPPLRDELLTDFKLFQPGHAGWHSIAVEVAQLNIHYARTALTKPLVVGEIGYEMLGRKHLEDFQRLGFWLGMLNGAAGYTYGAAGTWEAYSEAKLFRLQQWTLLTWRDGMKLPGSYQVGLNAGLLKRYPWWRFAPRPDWITPRGTTLLEPRGGIGRFHIDLSREWSEEFGLSGWNAPESEWARRQGNFHLPYAAGIPGEVRVIYLPYMNVVTPEPPTILKLEEGVRYHAYYWEPTLGIKVDLGAIERPAPGAPINPSSLGHGKLTRTGHTLAVADAVNEASLVAAVDAQSDTDAALVLRFQDPDNYLAAAYSQAEKAIYLFERNNGVDGPPLGRTAVTSGISGFHLTAELRNGMGMMTLTSGTYAVSTPIVAVKNIAAGRAGLTCRCAAMRGLENFEVRQSPAVLVDGPLQRKLYDATGQYRGELTGAGGPGSGLKTGWDKYATNKHLLLDAYRPPLPPAPGDWVLVLEKD